jgi:hypothetical protein
MSETFDAKKGKIAKKAHRVFAKKAKKKKILVRPPRPSASCSKKKNKERALSLFSSLSHQTYKRRKTYISMAGARLIVFYFVATLSP